MHVQIYIHIYIWEGRSQKVSKEESYMRFCHGNFRPLISHAFAKPCLRGVVVGFLDARRVLGFTIGSWIHNGFLDS